MNTKKIITQVKRECWENKTAFFYTPLILTALIIVIIIGVAIAASHLIDPTGVHVDMSHTQADGNIDMGDGIQFNLHNFDLSAAAKEHPHFFGSIIAGIILMNSALLATVFAIVLLIYAHNCLFDDRKTRDIQFWRSMPVSETTTVLVKMLVLVCLAPVVMTALNIVVGIVSFILSIIFFTAHGVSLGAVFSSIMDSDAITVVFRVFGGILLALTLFIPMFSFFIFCSALAKKSPVFTSSLIPIVLLFIDKVLRSTLAINLHIMDIFTAYWHSFLSLMKIVMPENFALDSAALLTFIIAVCVGGLLVVATILLRNHRYEL